MAAVNNFTLKTLSDMIARMPLPQTGYARGDRLTIGHRTYLDIATYRVCDEPIGAPSFYGIPVQVSALFPYTQKCKVCEGTGEGRDSTYCPKCRGGGEYTVEGAVTSRDDSITMILAYRKKRFEPRWPREVRVPLRRLGEQ